MEGRASWRQPAGGEVNSGAVSDPRGRGPTLGGARRESSRTATRDGLLLAGEHHLRDDPRSRIVIVHGYGEHRGRYGRLVGELVAAGHECHLLDLRGHGESGGGRGEVSDVADYRDDVRRFLVAASRLGSGPPGEGAPWVLLGHSMGGLVALDFLLHERFGFAGLVLSSPFLAPGFEVSRTLRRLVGLAARIVPRLRLPTPLGREALSHDPEVLAAYDADPKVFSAVMPRWTAAILAAQDEIAARAGEIRLPTLMLLGTADRIASPARGREIFARLGSADKRLIEYEGFLHEVLNELDRDRPVADLLAWLADHTPR